MSEDNEISKENKKLPKISRLLLWVFVGIIIILFFFLYIVIREYQLSVTEQTTKALNLPLLSSSPVVSPASVAVQVSSTCPPASGLSNNCDVLVDTTNMVGGIAALIGPSAKYQGKNVTVCAFELFDKNDKLACGAVVACDNLPLLSTGAPRAGLAYYPAPPPGGRIVPGKGYEFGIKTLSAIFEGGQVLVEGFLKAQEKPLNFTQNGYLMFAKAFPNIKYYGRMPINVSSLGGLSPSSSGGVENCTVPTGDNYKIKFLGAAMVGPFGGPPNFRVHFTGESNRFTIKSPPGAINSPPPGANDDLRSLLNSLKALTQQILQIIEEIEGRL